MIKLKLTILFIMFITVSGCSEFAMLMSAGGMAASHNSYVKAYNSMDVLMIMHSDKSIKKDIYPDSDHNIVSYYQCDECDTWYEVFHDKKKEKNE